LVLGIIAPDFFIDRGRDPIGADIIGYLTDGIGSKFGLLAPQNFLAAADFQFLAEQKPHFVVLVQFKVESELRDLRVPARDLLHVFHYVKANFLDISRD
jgi:hypothetical protein